MTEEQKKEQQPTLSVAIGVENGLVAFIFEAGSGCLSQKVLLTKDLAENLIKGIQATINKLESRIITQ